MIDRVSGAEHQDGATTVAKAPGGQPAGDTIEAGAYRPLLALVGDSAEAVAMAAREIIDALKVEADCLTRELRETRAKLDEYEPIATNLAEFSRLADSAPLYLVTVRYRRRVRFTGADAWNHARAFIKAVRHQQADAIMHRVFSEDPNDE